MDGSDQYGQGYSANQYQQQQTLQQQQAYQQQQQSQHYSQMQRQPHTQTTQQQQITAQQRVQQRAQEQRKHHLHTIGLLAPPSRTSIPPVFEEHAQIKSELEDGLKHFQHLIPLELTRLILASAGCSLNSSAESETAISMVSIATQRVLTELVQRAYEFARLRMEAGKETVCTLKLSDVLQSMRIMGLDTTQ